MAGVLVSPWRVAVLVAVAAVCGAAVAGRAQSLAEVARQEQERRKQIKTPSRVYTNEDLKRTTAPLTTGAATPEALKRPEGEASPPAAPAPAPGAAAEPKKDEAYWRERIGAARQALERQQLFLEALQSRANALYAEFVARDDPAQRAVLERERQRVLTEMDRVKGDIERLTKEVADIEEEARRAGVPPGWLR